MTIEETRTENLKLLADRYASIKSFSDAIGKDRSMVSQWVNNTKSTRTGKPIYIGTGSCRAIETALGLPIGWMDEKHTDTPQPPATDDTPQEGCIVYNLLDIQAAAGAGCFNTDYPQVVTQISVSEEWAVRELGPGYTNLHLITAKGVSMSPTIEDGDVLFVKPIQQLDYDGVYVIAMDGTARVKRLQRLSGDRLAVISDNKLFQTEIFQGEAMNTITICGQVIHALHSKKIS